MAAVAVAVVVLVLVLVLVAGAVCGPGRVQGNVAEPLIRLLALATAGAVAAARVLLWLGLRFLLMFVVMCVFGVMVFLLGLVVSSAEAFLLAIRPPPSGCIGSGAEPMSAAVPRGSSRFRFRFSGGCEMFRASIPAPAAPVGRVEKPATRALCLGLSVRVRVSFRDRDRDRKRTLVAIFFREHANPAR